MFRRKPGRLCAVIKHLYQGRRPLFSQPIEAPRIATSYRLSSGPNWGLYPQSVKEMAPLKIDTHQHVFPPLVRKAIERNPTLAQGIQPPPWTPSTTLTFMEHNSINTSILSCPMSLTAICQDNAAETATLAREVNLYLASLRDQYPTQLGFFASLPSPADTTRCIEEIQYALDILKADGVALFTSYSDKYLGHPDFEAVWQELNTRKAVVFTHPTMEDRHKSIVEPFTIPRPLLDWPHETTRMAVHMILTGALRRYASDCRIILSHGGGTLPFVAERMANLDTQTRVSGKSAEEFLAEARLFYFDLALVGHEMSLGLVLDFAADGHVLYGTDFPFVRDDTVARQWGAVGGEELVAKTWKTAQALFPRLNH